MWDDATADASGAPSGVAPLPAHLLPLTSGTASAAADTTGGYRQTYDTLSPGLHLTTFVGIHNEFAPLHVDQTSLQICTGCNLGCLVGNHICYSTQLTLMMHTHLQGLAALKTQAVSHAARASACA